MFFRCLCDPDRSGKSFSSPEALALLRKSAALGFAPARAYLGYFMATGRYVPKDEANGRQLLEQAAAQNDPDAACSLGILYSLGAGGLPLDFAKAEEQLRRAGELGTDRAHRVLAQVLLRSKRPAEAVAELEAGVAAGSDSAMRDLAKWKEEALAGPQDLPGAFRLYLRLASEWDEPADAVQVGRMYRDGVGTAPAPDQAFLWFRRAAAAGSPAGKYLTGQSYLTGSGVGMDVGKGVVLLREAAEAGYLDAQVALASGYLEGVWVDRDVGAATKWFERAAKQGSGEAAVILPALRPAGRSPATAPSTSETADKVGAKTRSPAN
jgi:hypothetical protein